MIQEAIMTLVWPISELLAKTRLLIWIMSFIFVDWKNVFVYRYNVPPKCIYKINEKLHCFSWLTILSLKLPYMVTHVYSA